MKKVKCINGHFFDADRFSNCPSCGAAPVGSSENQDKSAIIKPQVVTQPLQPPVGLEPAVSKNDAPLVGWGQSHIDAARVKLAETVFLSDDNRHPPQQIQSSEAKDDLIQASIQSEGVSAKGTLADAVESTASKKTSAFPKTTAFYDAGDIRPPVGWLVCIRGTYVGRAFECKVGRSRIGRNLDMDICLSEDSSISRDVHAAIIYEPKNRIFYLQAGVSSGLTYHNGNLIFDHEELHAYDKIELGKTEFLFFPLCGENFTWDDYMEKD